MSSARGGGYVLLFHTVRGVLCILELMPCSVPLFVFLRVPPTQVTWNTHLFDFSAVAGV